MGCVQAYFASLARYSPGAGTPSFPPPSLLPAQVGKKEEIGRGIEKKEERMCGGGLTTLRQSNLHKSYPLMHFGEAERKFISP